MRSKKRRFANPDSEYFESKVPCARALAAAPISSGYALPLARKRLAKGSEFVRTIGVRDS